MDFKSPSLSNESSPSTIRSQEANSSKYSNSSLYSSNLKMYLNGGIGTGSQNSYFGTGIDNNIAGFTPLQPNWQRVSSYSGDSLLNSTSSNGALNYSMSNSSQSLGVNNPQSLHYKNSDSLDMNYRNLSLGSNDAVKFSLNTFQSAASDSQMSELKSLVGQKDRIINSLKEENSRLQLILQSQDETAKTRSAMPASHYKLFERLSTNLLTLQDKYNESELHLESLLTAISLSPQQSVTENGRYDCEEIAHKIIAKIEILQEENTEMAKILSFGRSKQKDIEIKMLRSKIAELESKIHKFVS